MISDGFPPGFEITAEEIRIELMRRATGQSRHTSQSKEEEDVQITSGMFEGKTTGTPIALLIYNTDAALQGLQQDCPHNFVPVTLTIPIIYVESRYSLLSRWRPFIGPQRRPCAWLLERWLGDS